MREFNAPVTNLYVIVEVLIIAFAIFGVIYIIGVSLSILRSEFEFGNEVSLNQTDKRSPSLLQRD